jgi:hypothetical protein
MCGYYVNKDDELLEVSPRGSGQYREAPFPVRLTMRHDSRLLPNVCDFILRIDRKDVVILTDSFITMDIGERIFVGFYIPYNNTFVEEFEGEVTGFCIDKRECPSGMYVKFVNYSDEKLRKLEDFFSLKGLNINLLV